MGSSGLVRRPLKSPNPVAFTAPKFYGSCTAMAPKKVCIVGSGNWGSAIARLVGFNAARLPDRFQREVAMWVFGEEGNGRKLTEIINTDLITTCYGGRNRKVSEAFVSRKKSIAELEVEMLNGQKLQGPETAAEVNYMLKARGLEADFPLFTTVHRICIGELQPEDLIDSLRNHPEHH